jgi:hypothetical protein
VSLPPAQQWMTRRVQRLTVAVIVGILVVLLAQTFRQAYRVDGYDLTSYLLSAKALWQGDNPYTIATPYGYIYPLFLAFLLIPLTLVPYWLANLLWFGMSVSCLFAVCQMLLKMADEGTVPVLASGRRRLSPGTFNQASDGRYLLPAAVVFAVMFSPIQNNLLNGQVNLIVLFCCTMFLRSYVREKKVTSAAWLSAAIAIKLVPAILVVFLLVRKQFRVLLWTALFAILFCLLPTIVAGTNAFAFYRDYWDSFFLPSLLGHAPKGSPSTCAQFLSVSKIPIFFGLHRTLQYFLPAAGSAGWVRAIAQSVSLLAVLAVDLAGRRARPLHRDTWAFSGYLLGCLLLSPVSEIHHLVFAVPAVCLVGARTFFDRRWTTKTVLAFTGGFVLCFDVAAGLYDKMPFFFLSLAILLALVFLANRDSGAEFCGQSQLGRC